MAGAGPMHWRGDRTGAATGGDALDEDLAFKAFNPAFVGLLGRDTQLTAARDAGVHGLHPDRAPAAEPDPRTSNDSLDDPAARARSRRLDFFLNTADRRRPHHVRPLPSSCRSAPTASRRSRARRRSSRSPTSGTCTRRSACSACAGDQVRGFGFLHDGSRAHGLRTSSRRPSSTSAAGRPRSAETSRRSRSRSTRAQAPAVGQQVTVTPATVNDTDLVNRIDLLIARDDAGACDLIVKGTIGGVARGCGLRRRQQLPARSERRRASSTRRRCGTSRRRPGRSSRTRACRSGSGTRIGVDRDLDGTFDRRELDCGTDPANPASVPATSTGSCGSTTTTTFPTTHARRRRPRPPPPRPPRRRPPQRQRPWVRRPLRPPRRRRRPRRAPRPQARARPPRLRCRWARS